MKKLWSTHKVFIWLPWALSDMLSISINQAKALILAGKVKNNGLLIRDIDLGLGDGQHKIECEGYTIDCYFIVYGDSGIDDLPLDQLDTEALKRGDKITLGPAVVQKVKNTLTVCYHSSEPGLHSAGRRAFLELFGFNTPAGTLITGCMASV